MIDFIFLFLLVQNLLSVVVKVVMIVEDVVKVVGFSFVDVFKNVVIDMFGELKNVEMMFYKGVEGKVLICEVVDVVMNVDCLFQMVIVICDKVVFVYFDIIKMLI